MKILVAVLVMAITVLGIISSASADPIIITPSTSAITGNDNSTLTDGQISTLVGSAVYLLYKAEVGAVVSYSGPFASAYTTTFSNAPTDPEDALIQHVVGSAIINVTPLYLYVKDGSQIPAFYIFNLGTLGWNGQDNLDLQDFWLNQGAISHVSIYGGTTTVPEPTTLLLLGFGLVGLAGISRKLKK